MHAIVRPLPANSLGTQRLGRGAIRLLDVTILCRRTFNPYLEPFDRKPSLIIAVMIPLLHLVE